MNNKTILSDSIVYLKGIIGETKKEEAKLAALATKDRYLVSGINETRGYQSNVDNVNTHRYHRFDQFFFVLNYIVCFSKKKILKEVFFFMLGDLIEVDMVDREHFILKMSCSKEMGVLSYVQQMIKSLGMDVTSPCKLLQSLMSEVPIEDVPESGTEDHDYEAVITYK
ncbi:hypothetical protein GIB67_042072 [Kingdonia uniflora]|uniref:Uncharacterized protein n=1 Tax=Kingdonia uniflora TaxID=39325 RepID=A0A7J7MVP2_9MAGN|nr:hypothetical protein GIB67_042072 [Kingdonia uniflora]